MTKINFDFDFGGLTISQSQYGSKTRMTGAMHRLTPEQFDALTSAFGLTSKYSSIDPEIQTLTVEGGRSFRTADINMGGLIVSLFADVVEEGVAA